MGSKIRIAVSLSGMPRHSEECYKNTLEFFDANGCEVDFFLDFEFRSRILEKAIGNLFADAVYRMVVAFEVRANQLYKQEQLS